MESWSCSVRGDEHKLPCRQDLVTHSSSWEDGLRSTSWKPSTQSPEMFCKLGCLEVPCCKPGSKFGSLMPNSVVINWDILISGWAMSLTSLIQWAKTHPNNNLVDWSIILKRKPKKGRLWLNSSQAVVYAEAIRKADSDFAVTCMKEQSKAPVLPSPVPPTYCRWAGFMYKPAVFQLT